MMECPLEHVVLEVGQEYRIVWILYKEIAQFPPTVSPWLTLNGRQLVEVNDDTFNSIKGNVKVIDDDLVAVAKHYNQLGRRYFTNEEGATSGSIAADTNEKSTKATSELTIKVEYDFSDSDAAKLLKLAKIVITANIEDVFFTRFKALNRDKPELESGLFKAQSEEAKAYLADNSVSTPVLTILAGKRGITVSDMVTKITTKESEYNSNVAEILGNQQALISELKECSNIKEILQFNEEKFGLQMPDSLAEELELTTEGTNTRKVAVKYGIQF